MQCSPASHHHLSFSRRRLFRQRLFRRPSATLSLQVKPWAIAASVYKGMCRELRQSFQLAHGLLSSCDCSCEALSRGVAWSQRPSWQQKREQRTTGTRLHTSGKGLLGRGCLASLCSHPGMFSRLSGLCKAWCQARATSGLRSFGHRSRPGGTFCTA